MRTLLLLLLIMPAFGLAQQMKKYYNDRFSYSISFPSNFKIGTAPGNNDGRVFTSPDKKATISCAGHYLYSSLNDEYKDYSEGVAVAYKTIKPDFFAFSGYTSDGNVYYQKTIRKKMEGDNNYLVASVWIKYPANQKNYYDKICQSVAASLK